MKHLILMLWIFIFLVPSSVSAQSSTNMTIWASSPIVVPDDYPTIQSAIDDASEGSTIFVRNGTYFEHLDITKSVRIYGSDEAPTILKSSWTGHMVSIRANYVTFAKFQIEGARDSFGAGIYIEQGHHNLISDNIISGNRYGIYLWDSSNITLRNNNMTNNRLNFGVWGLFLSHFLQDVDDSNVVEGKPICYWVSQENKTVPTNAGYVALVNCTGVIAKYLNVTNNFQGLVVCYSVFTTIQNISSSNNSYGIHMLASDNNIIVQNNVSNNNVGLLLDLSRNNHIAENSFFNNTQGIMFSYSPLTPLRCVENNVYNNNITYNGGGILIAEASRNRFWGNKIAFNTRWGVFASSSSLNILCGNTFHENSCGIWLQKSSNNTIYNNNFVNNTSHIHIDNSVNFWNSSQAIGGNYWNDNVVVDVDKDGIVDLPYATDEYNVDHYPLAGLFSNHTVFWENSKYPLLVISNSSALFFEFFSQQRKVVFNFTGPEQTLGFCRISIPRSLSQSLWQDDVTVLVDGVWSPDMRRWEDNASVYVYFTYPHPNSQAVVIPEFPFSPFLTLFLMLFSVAVFVVKKCKHFSKRRTGEIRRTCTDESFKKCDRDVFRC